LYHSFEGHNTKESIAKINEDLHRVLIWSQKNCLALNPDKTQALVLGTKHQMDKVLSCGEEIIINNKAVKKVKSARNLGLIIDAEQRYEEHIGEKIKNAFFKLKTLYKLRPYIKEELRIRLCDVLVLSLFNYCSAVYGPRLKARTGKAIQRVQNACARFSFDVPRQEHITPYLNKRRILNMAARRELLYACTVHKTIWNKKPDYLFEKLTWIKTTTQRSLRSVLINNLKIPKHSSTRYRGSFKFSASSIWNDLPPPIKTKMTLATFKKKYTNALFNRQLDVENITSGSCNSIRLKEYFECT
jgi:hypothetical protein